MLPISLAIFITTCAKCKIVALVFNMRNPSCCLFAFIPVSDVLQRKVWRKARSWFVSGSEQAHYENFALASIQLRPCAWKKGVVPLSRYDLWLERFNWIDTSLKHCTWSYIVIFRLCAAKCNKNTSELVSSKRCYLIKLRQFWATRGSQTFCKFSFLFSQLNLYG